MKTLFSLAALLGSINAYSAEPVFWNTLKSAVHELPRTGLQVNSQQWPLLLNEEICFKGSPENAVAQLLLQPTYEGSPTALPSYSPYVKKWSTDMIEIAVNEVACTRSYSVPCRDPDGDETTCTTCLEYGMVPSPGNDAKIPSCDKAATSFYYPSADRRMSFNDVVDWREGGKLVDRMYQFGIYARFPRRTSAVVAVVGETKRRYESESLFQLQFARNAVSADGSSVTTHDGNCSGQKTLKAGMNGFALQCKTPLPGFGKEFFLPASILGLGVGPQSYVTPEFENLKGFGFQATVDSELVELSPTNQKEFRGFWRDSLEGFWEFILRRGLNASPSDLCIKGSLASAFSELSRFDEQEVLGFANRYRFNLDPGQPLAMTQFKMTLQPEIQVIEFFFKNSRCLNENSNCVNGVCHCDPQHTGARDGVSSIRRVLPVCSQ